MKLKKKVMLAILAGGMLCANGALATPAPRWYGTTGNQWTTNSDEAVATGLILTIDANTKDKNGSGWSSIERFYGGYSSGDVSGNTINIIGGALISGQYFIGGQSENGSGNNNHVYFDGATLAAPDAEITIEGGFGKSGANGNSVHILSDTDCNGVMGVLGGEAADGGTAQGNNVYIGNEEATTVFNNLKFWEFIGGRVHGPLDYTNNTLHIRTKNLLAGQVGGFDTINFTLPASIQNNDTILTTVFALAVGYNSGTATINVKAANGVSLKSGEKITLIDATAEMGAMDTFVAGDVLGGAGKIVFEDGSGTEIAPTSLTGVPLVIILEMLKDFEQKEPEPPQSNEDKEKAPVEGIAATAAMINQSADLASDEGLNNLVLNTADGTFDTFGAINANRSKYKTGSHVDMDGWGFLVGAGNTKKWKNGEKTTYGLFFEYGKGEFDTYNNDIHGEGDSNNKGVGIIARHTLNNNTYFDGAIRYGKQETEWNETEIGSYDTDCKYFGTSLGIGHIYPIGKNELDIYGRYTYGHTGSCDAKVGENEYEFDAVKSSRIRFGAKYNFVQQNKQIKPYIGLAWEREMKGESKATITGIGEAPAPSLKGNTGIFEIGCDWEAGKWILGAEANAYIGKRKGWGGMFNAFYNF